jgi:alpha-1,3-rhamnosyltransferase
MTVTICVTTYNSANFILETLESIYSQSFPNLSLVISDDCSSDETIEIAQNWVAQDKIKSRFQSIHLITVPNNTGVSANCNRCIQASSSDWVKLISGDDILLPNCIDDNINFTIQNPDARIIFSQINLYQDHFEEKNYIETTPLEFPSNIMDPSLSAQDQYNMLLLCDRIHFTPSFFTHKQTILEVGGYDENNKLVEDYPMWLKLTKAGIRLNYFHKITVGYRIHSRAINNVSDSVLFKPSIFNSFKIRKQLVHSYLPWEIVASEYHIYEVSRFFSLMNWNKKKKIHIVLYRLCCIYFNPFQYVYSVRKRLSKSKNKYFYR